MLCIKISNHEKIDFFLLLKPIINKLIPEKIKLQQPLKINSYLILESHRLNSQLYWSYLYL